MEEERLYSEEELKVLLIKALTHNDYDLCGSLATKDREIRTANFEVWFEHNKKQNDCNRMVRNGNRKT